MAAPPSALVLHPGKRLQLVRGAEVVVVQSHGVEASGAVLVDHVSLRGSIVLRVRFLGERYSAQGRVLEGEGDTSRVVLDEELRLANERAFPRANVRANGVLYVKPPLLGVPMEILDLSISGLAMRPAELAQPTVGERRMVAIDLRSRQIKSVIEFVGCDHDRWRGRFLHLGLSDEAAIASFVLSEQTRQRGSLAATEAELSSSLDPGERVRYSLLDEIRIEADAVVLRCRDDEERVPCSSVDDDVRIRLEELSGQVRLAEPADMFWLLEVLGVPEPVADSVLLAYWVLAARAISLDVVEVCGLAWPQRTQEGLLGTPDPSAPSRPDQRELLVAKAEQSRKHVATDPQSTVVQGRAKVEAARCCGLGLLGDGQPQLGRIDPLRLLLMLRGDSYSIQPLPGPLRDTPTLARVAQELRRWARCQAARPDREG